MLLFSNLYVIYMRYFFCQQILPYNNPSFSCHIQANSNNGFSDSTCNYLSFSYHIQDRRCLSSSSAACNYPSFSYHIQGDKRYVIVTQSKRIGCTYFKRVSDIVRKDSYECFLHDLILLSFNTSLF